MAQAIRLSLQPAAMVPFADFLGSDGKNYRYQIQYPQDACRTGSGPLVVYLPSTMCEPPNFQCSTSSAVSLLTFEIRNSGKNGAAWTNPFPTWIGELLRSLRNDPLWSNVDWFLFACSRGAAWGLEVITDERIRWKEVMLVAPYLRKPVKNDESLCDKIQQSLSRSAVVVFIGQYDGWKPCDRLLGILTNVQASIRYHPLDHDMLLKNLQLQVMLPDLLGKGDFARQPAAPAQGPNRHHYCQPAAPTAIEAPHPTTNVSIKALGVFASTAEKLRFLEEYKYFPKRIKAPRIPVQRGVVSNVIILSSFSPETRQQMEKATQMFRELGFSNVIRVRGIDSNSPGGVWPIDTCSWLRAFGPKLFHMLEEWLPDDEPFCIAQDSVWPTNECTPSYLHMVFSKYNNSGYDAVWAGADIIDGMLGGCELLIGTRSFVERLWQSLLESSNTTSVSVVMRQLVAKPNEVVAIMPKFLAGTQMHWCSLNRQLSGLKGVPLQLKSGGMDIA